MKRVIRLYRVHVQWNSIWLDFFFLRKEVSIFCLVALLIAGRAPKSGFPNHLGEVMIYLGQNPVRLIHALINKLLSKPGLSQQVRIQKTWRILSYQNTTTWTLNVYEIWWHQSCISFSGFWKPSYARYEKASQNREGKIIFICFPFPFFCPPYLPFFSFSPFFNPFSPLFLPFFPPPFFKASQLVLKYFRL